MTFIGRFNIFECNGCSDLEQVSNFPTGWIFTTPKMGSIEHYCENCQKDLPPGTRVFNAGDKNGKVIKKEDVNAQG